MKGAYRLPRRTRRFHRWLDNASLYLAAFCIASVALNCAYGAGWFQ